MRTNRNKIVLGLASFDNEYGINRKNIFNKNEIKKILSFFLKSSPYIDFSKFYKTGYNFFLNKSNISKKIKFILKIQITKNFKNEEIKIKREIFKIKEKLNVKKFYCIMIHNGDDLVKFEIINQVYYFLNTLRANKITEKIGFSSYDEYNSLKILKKTDFHILQFPYNIFDQRLKKKFFFNFLKKKNIEVHLRSIFLQGLFSVKKNDLNPYFKKWRKNIFDLQNFCDRKKINLLELAYNFANNLQLKKKIIIGIKNFDQLQQIYTFKKFKTGNLSKFRIDDKKLILPFLWKIKKI